MPSPDPHVRRLAAQVAIYSRHAGGPPARPQPDACVPEYLRERYYDEVDPQRCLTDRQRRAKAASAFKRDQTREALRAYRSSRPTSGDAA